MYALCSPVPTLQSHLSLPYPVDRCMVDPQLKQLRLLHLVQIRPTSKYSWKTKPSPIIDLTVLSPKFTDKIPTGSPISIGSRMITIFTSSLRFLVGMSFLMLVVL
ncbi:hypothetical protein BpHYR1_023196 [Brachionus plicatilis]|uniref:Uncharacterized protein n=1 Tax=Brachionus plicatilis TaxID=10195 RepID=A0A3M7PUB9_BRAPC|nr:hypothetical protein BpHYR1_023196 [Brachionus plicatilis]